MIGMTQRCALDSKGVSLEFWTDDWRSTLRCWFWWLAVTAVAVLGCATSSAWAEQPRTLAFLGVVFQNDNAGLQPTTDAERAREQKVVDLFKRQLEASGRFKFISTPPAVLADIASSGQNLGECHGCETDYGRRLGADEVAWVKIQKVSNLILNLNVFMADVSTEKMTFAHSVDIRGNTDESWTRSLTYLVNNYLLAK